MVCGSSTSIDFNVSGVPIPNMTVFKGDQLLTENEHFQIHFEKEKFTLTIKLVVLEDEGTYKLTAENKAGQAVSTVKLNTQGIMVGFIVILLSTRL